VLQQTVAKQCSIHFAFYQCHDCFGPQPVCVSIANAMAVSICHDCWWIVACCFHTFFKNRHCHYATVPVLLCCDAITIAFLAGTAASGWLLFARKLLRHHHWFDCMSCFNAAAIVPWWWCCCHCAMLLYLCWLSGTVATGWLFFFYNF